MKKIILTTLALAGMSFASENAGAADALASFIFVIFILGALYAAVPACLAGIAAIIEGLYEFFAEMCRKVCHLWRIFNSFARILFFGVPLTVVSYFVFYGLFYYVFPFFIHSVFPFIAYEIIPFFVYNVVGNVILGVVAYLLLMFLGWKYGFAKKKGVVALIARILVLLPVLPVIYFGYYFCQFFKLMFIKDAKCNFLPTIVRYSENDKQYVFEQESCCKKEVSVKRYDPNRHINWLKDEIERMSAKENKSISDKICIVNYQKMLEAEQG